MPTQMAQVTMKGQPLGLTGNEVKVGAPAPDFKVVDNNLQEVTLKNFAGKVKVMCSVPSLDTPVCDTEVRKFNEQVAALGGDVILLVISMDLPFAQSRWCGAAGIANVHTLSDYKEAIFGKNYGVLIGDLRLLARAVFVVDKTDTVQYIEVVSELTNEPDYVAAIEAAKKVV